MNHSSLAPHVPRRGKSLFSKCAFALVASGIVCGFLALPARAEDNFDITVRSFVESQEHLFGKKHVIEHSKLYAIAGIKAAASFEHDTSTPLSIPVDEDALRASLKKVLSDHGFQEIAWGKIPDIVITAIYGRDQIKNPYTANMTEVDGAQIGMSGVKVVSGSYDQIEKERGDPGYNAKRQKATGEKLFMLISGWKNPGMFTKEQDHAKLLWRVTVFVDDPNTDLNLVEDKMIAAAGNYFDRAIPKEEITLESKDVPTGRVTIGTPVEVDPAKE